MPLIRLDFILRSLQTQDRDLQIGELFSGGGRIVCVLVREFFWLSRNPPPSQEFGTVDPRLSIHGIYK